MARHRRKAVRITIKDGDRAITFNLGCGPEARESREFIRRTLAAQRRAERRCKGNNDQQP